MLQTKDNSIYRYQTKDQTNHCPKYNLNLHLKTEPFAAGADATIYDWRLAQFGSGSRVMLSILKEKNNNFRENQFSLKSYILKNYKKIMSPEEIYR